MVAPTETKELVFDDVPFEGGTEAAAADTIPEDTYYARLVGFRSNVEKPAWKVDQQWANEQRKHPDTTRESIDPYQYEFTFEITGPADYEGVRLANYTNRTFHERSTAGKIVAALMGMDVFIRSVLEAQGGTSILRGRPCRIDVVEKQGKDGVYRNYINDVKRIPEKRDRPARSQSAPQPPGPAVRLADYPQDDEDDIAF